MRCFTYLGGTALSLALVTTAYAQEESKPELKLKTKPGAVGVINDVVVDTVARKYTLGTKLTSIPNALDAQLALEGKGALVAEVTAGGPADKAGVKLHDVLVQIDELPVTGLGSVVDMLNASEGKEVSLALVRGGDIITLKAQPDIFKVADANPTISLSSNIDIEQSIPGLGAIEGELGAIEEKIREKLKDAGIDIRMQFIRPGHMLPHTIAKVVTIDKLPDNLDIEVRKHGNEPTEIEVRQDDQTWKVKENELDKLPEEVRKHVEGVLGRRPRMVIGTAGQKFEMALPADAIRVFSDRVARHPEIMGVTEKVSKEVQKRAKEIEKEAGRIEKHARGTVERRLEEMSREMERMQARMEELRRAVAEEDKSTPQAKEQGSEEVEEHDNKDEVDQ